MEIKEALAAVYENMEKVCLLAGREKNSVKLVAVTKYVDTDRIAEAFAGGVTDVGENHAQELREKLTFYKLQGVGVHFIGQLQSNKIKYVCKNAALIHSVDREKLLLDLNDYAGKLDVIQEILLQVNIGREEQKGGVSPEDTPYLLEKALSCGHVRVRGLMCVPPAVEPAEARKYFAALYELREKMTARFPELPLRELSMGMSHDYPQAIMEGATMIRVGSAIFGARNKL